MYGRQLERLQCDMKWKKQFHFCFSEKFFFLETIGCFTLSLSVCTNHRAKGCVTARCGLLLSERFCMHLEMTWLPDAIFFVSEDAPFHCWGESVHPLPFLDQNSNSSTYRCYSPGRFEKHLKMSFWIASDGILEPNIRPFALKKKSWFMVWWLVFDMFSVIHFICISWLLRLLTSKEVKSCWFPQVK